MTIWLTNLVKFSRGDTAAARADLRTLKQQRQRVDPSDLTFEGLYPEASLLHLLGDDEAAAAWLDPKLPGCDVRGLDYLLHPPKRDRSFAPQFFEATWRRHWVTVLVLLVGVKRWTFSGRMRMGF